MVHFGFHICEHTVLKAFNGIWSLDTKFKKRTEAFYDLFLITKESILLLKTFWKDFFHTKRIIIYSNQYYTFQNIKFGSDNKNYVSWIDQLVLLLLVTILYHNNWGKTPQDVLTYG